MIFELPVAIGGYHLYRRGKSGCSLLFVQIFATIKATAGADLKALILAAASGSVPDGKAAEKRHYQSQGKTWFKSVDGGRELAAKLFSLGLWPALKPQLLPFCNAVRKAVDLDELPDLTP